MRNCRARDGKNNIKKIWATKNGESTMAHATRIGSSLKKVKMHNGNSIHPDGDGYTAMINSR